MQRCIQTAHDKFSPSSLGQRVWPVQQLKHKSALLGKLSRLSGWLLAISTCIVLTHLWPLLWSQSGIINLYFAFTLLALVVAAIAYRTRLRYRHQWRLAQHKRQLAEQASLAKTRFLANLSHEIRTPMTGVLGMTELLLTTPLNQTQQRYVQAIAQAGDHLLRLVNDALDLARIEAGRLELEQKTFALTPLLDEVAAWVAPIAEKQALQFIHQPPALDVSVTGDATRLRQILLNLLNNAVKFTERGQIKLNVELLPERTGICLHIADTGPGINARQQQSLFQRFVQVGKASSHTRYSGSGLGLAICQELAAAMGGHIRLDSRLGQGAHFMVELPLPWQLLNSNNSPETKPATSVSHLGGSLRILLVEDDLTVAEVISTLLRAQGHQLVHAAHGLAALSEAATQPFDLALLDLDLPALDGLAVAAQLRHSGHRFPLLVVTARSDAQVEQQVREAGIEGFLRKPVTGPLLAQAIAELCVSSQ